MSRCPAVCVDAQVRVVDRHQALHDSLFVADLHADELLWARDPLRISTRGHTDVPRLIEGNVALHVFSVVTKTPRGINFDQNAGETDNITLLAIAQRWPITAWSSLSARAPSGGAITRCRGAIIWPAHDYSNA